MSTQYRLVQSGKTASGGCSATDYYYIITVLSDTVLEPLVNPTTEPSNFRL
jgi:hypothetical protein